jgi:hypothetical protein
LSIDLVSVLRNLLISRKIETSSTKAGEETRLQKKKNGYNIPSVLFIDESLVLEVPTEKPNSVIFWKEIR